MFCPGHASHSWSDADLWHEVVNHSAGEIVNSNGFTTNHIENRWSLVKRWVRKRMGGRLPLHSNRETWTRLLNEFHWRKIVAHGHILDWGHTWYVPLTEAMATLRSYSLTLGRGQWGDVPIRGTVSICTFRIHVDACAHLSLKPFPTIVGT